MSEDKPGVFEFLAGVAGIVVIGICAWLFISFCGWVGRGLHNFTTISPQEQASIDKANKEWETDPRNPKVVGQKCLDLGGVPDYSSWDGDVKACRKPGGGNVDIEQKVEVKQ